MQIELSIGRRLGPVTATNIYDLQYWCRDYNRRNKFPADNLKRFAIGFYQIHQGMSWQDNGPNKYESFAAAILHFIMVAEKLELQLDGINSDTMKYAMYVPIRHIAYELLQNLSAAQQMLFYSNPTNKTKRSSRYDKNKLDSFLVYSITHLIKAIPVHMRTECFYLASKIMTDELK